MSLRQAIVEIEVTKGFGVAAFCEQHGISEWTFYELRRRHKRGESIEPRSRAPHTVANRTDPGVEDEIVAKRKELDEAGLDGGGHTIAWHLEGLEGLPSPSAINRILRRRGFVARDPSKAPKRSHRSFTAERANDTWQLDDTTWALADGTEVKVLNVLDDHSRLLVASVAARVCTGAFALSVLAAAAVVLGWPARFLSDNAPAFRHVLADALRPMGIGSTHSKPYHPQTNGKVERFHQTLKQWLAKQPAAADLAELQGQLDLFRFIYNHRRPHSAIKRRTPGSVWEAAPKSGPANHALGEPTTVHHSVVGHGVAWTGGNIGIALGVAWNGATAMTIKTGPACHVFVEGRLVRALVIDPSKRVQPLHPRPGRPRQS